MADRTVWRDHERQILAALEIRAAYEGLGVVFSRDTPSAAGWLPCHAAGREDNNPSAAVNIGNDHRRGKYVDMQSGKRASLWQFAAEFGGFQDWRAARKHFAEKANIKLPVGAEPRRPGDGIAFLRPEAGRNSMEQWAALKGGFSPDAIADAGGVFGRWPKTAKIEQAQYVACFPAWNGPAWLEDAPCAWVIARTDGKNVELFQGKYKPPTLSKTLSVGGSSGGLLNRQALTRLAPPMDIAPNEEIIPPELVWKVEGLTDLLALIEQIKLAGFEGKHVAISNSQGANEAVKPEWLQVLDGYPVYVVGDADQPGQTGAENWCFQLAARGETRNVQLPYPIEPNHGKDLRDYFRDGHSYNDLLALAQATQVYQPRQAQPDQALAPAGSLMAPEAPTSLGSSTAGPADQFDAETWRQQARDVLAPLGIQVLGQLRGGTIRLYSRECGIVEDIGNLEQFKFLRLLQVGGPNIRRHVHKGQDDVQGMMTMSTIREAIATLASETNLDAVGMLGQGVWRLDTRLVLVNGGSGALVDGDRLEVLDGPKVNAQTILDFDNSDPWTDFDQLRDLLPLANDPAWCGRVLDDAQDLFAMFKWDHPLTYPQMLAGFTAATFVQAVLRYRPRVVFTGVTDAGKSTLCRCMKKVFGRLAIAATEATEAGVRQAIQRSSSVLLLDELDKNPQRDRIMATLRAASSEGSLSLRGTSDQRGRTFTLNQLPWLSGISLNMREAADQNRTLVYNIIKPTPAERDKGHKLPTEEALAELGTRLLAVAIRHAHEVARVAYAIRGTLVDGVDARLVAGYAVAAAMTAVVTGKGEAGAVALLKTWMADAAPKGQVVADHDRLARVLLAAKVFVGGGMSRSVAEILTDQEMFDLHADDLERSGVAVKYAHNTNHRPTKVGDFGRIVFDPVRCVRELLKGTDYEKADIKDLLRHLPGAEEKKARVAKTSVPCILVPCASLPFDDGPPPPVVEHVIDKDEAGVNKNAPAAGQAPDAPAEAPVQAQLVFDPPAMVVTNEMADRILASLRDSSPLPGSSDADAVVLRHAMRDPTVSVFRLTVGHAPSAPSFVLKSRIGEGGRIMTPPWSVAIPASFGEVGHSKPSYLTASLPA